MNIEVIHDVAVSPNLERGDGDDCRAYPMMARTPDGGVFCAYRHGASKHSYDGKLVGQISADAGQTWSDPITLFDGTGRQPPESLVSFHILAAADGSLLAIFAVVLATEPDAYLFTDRGRRQQRRIYKTRSRDGGRTWSPPRHVAQFDERQNGIVGKSLVLPDGEIFINSSCRRPEGNCAMTGCFSSDHGQTLGPMVDTVQDPQGKLNYDDPYYAVFPDGEIVGLFWTFDRQSEETIAVHRCTSRDSGRTWSAPQPVGMLGQISVPLVLDDRRLLAACNFRQEPDGLRLWMSEDRGVTFDRHLPVQMWDAASRRLVAEPIQPNARATRNEGVWDALEKFSFGTPDLLDLGDGTILLSFYATAGGVIHVRTCRFKVQ